MMKIKTIGIGCLILCSLSCKTRYIGTNTVTTVRDTIIVPKEVKVDSLIYIDRLLSGPVHFEDSTGQTTVDIIPTVDKKALDFKIHTKPQPIKIEKVYVDKTTTVTIEKKVTPWYAKAAMWVLAFAFPLSLIMGWLASKAGVKLPR